MKNGLYKVLFLFPHFSFPFCDSLHSLEIIGVPVDLNGFCWMTCVLSGHVIALGGLYLRSQPLS